MKAGVAKLATDDGDLALLASLDMSTETGKRDRAIILLLLGHGLRVGEVAQLYVEDLDGVFLKVMRKGAEQKTAVRKSGWDYEVDNWAHTQNCVPFYVPIDDFQIVSELLEH